MSIAQPAFKYRPEVDGLRAIAVLPVVFYHAGIELFSGGFVGVDIFFVISGYLITSILIRELQGDKFSLLKFYDRRVRRIFPALLFMLTVTLIAAWFLMLPKDLVDTGQSSFAAAIFASNILFWFKTGYFAGPAESKVLLHTWSLAVEEQFYVFFPPLLWAIWRFARRLLLPILCLLAAISLALCIAAMGIDENFAFYMFPTRAWELLAGCIIAVAPARRPMANLFTIIGLLMIGIAIFGFDASISFPGYAALLPVVGSGLVIHFSSGTAAAKLLTWRPMVVVGLLSYSLYLWHWPVLVFAKYWTIRPLTISETAVAIAVCFALAAFSWRYVEQPFRHIKNMSAVRVVAGGLAISAIPALAGVALVYFSGFPNRVSEPVRAAADARLYYPTQIENCTKMPGLLAAWSCRIGDPSAEPVFAVWGDSHAGSWLAGIDDAAQKNGTAGLLFTANGCPPVSGAKFRNMTNDCAVFEKMVRGSIAKSSVTRLVLVGRWSTYENDGKRLVATKDVWARQVAESIRRDAESFDISLVLPVPGSEYDVPSAAARKIMFNRPVGLGSRTGEILERDRLIRDIAKSLEDTGVVEVVDPLKLLCDSNACPATDGKTPRYTDESHLTKATSLMAAGLFDNATKAAGAR